jgi:hypothetical protein
MMPVGPLGAQTHSFSLRLLDAETSAAVVNASVRVGEKGRIHYSDKEGKVNFRHSEKTCRVVIRHLAYLPDTLILTADKPITVRLKSNRIELGIATVSENLPDTVYGSPQYHVADYAFSRHGLVLLTYEKERRWKRQEEAEITLYNGCRLKIIDEDGKEIWDFKVTDEAIGLYDSYPGEVFLNTRKGYFGIAKHEHLFLLQKVPDNQFTEWIEPIVDSIGPLIYFSNFIPSFPAFEYRILDKRDTTIHVMHRVIDRELMVQFRSEFKWMQPREKLEAFRLERKTGIDKEIIAAYMSGFPNSIYFQELYAPLFTRGDTVLIFDHYTERAHRFAGQTPLDSIPIHYHKKKPGAMKWNRQLVSDFDTQDIYSVFSKNGDYYLATIDLATGEALNHVKLHHRYPENIKVRSGEVFYQYRPFGSLQKKFLYKQRL